MHARCFARDHEAIRADDTALHNRLTAPAVANCPTNLNDAHFIDCFSAHLAFETELPVVPGLRIAWHEDMCFDINAHREMVSLCERVRYHRGWGTRGRRPTHEIGGSWCGRANAAGRPYCNEAWALRRRLSHAGLGCLLGSTVWGTHTEQSWVASNQCDTCMQTC